MSNYITNITFLFILCQGTFQSMAQARTEKYLIEYDHCGAIGFTREWLNDSTFIEKTNTDRFNDTFLVRKPGLYYIRKGEMHKFLSSQSFLNGDTIILYGFEYIKSTDLLLIADVYIPLRKDTLSGIEVLVYKIRGRHADIYYDEVYFDPGSLLIIRYKTSECGEGVVKRIR